jgi:hypothetical protein
MGATDRYPAMTSEIKSSPAGCWTAATDRYPAMTSEIKSSPAGCLTEQLTVIRRSGFTVTELQ